VEFIFIGNLYLKIVPLAITARKGLLEVTEPPSLLLKGFLISASLKMVEEFLEYT
jgi:hypothetical protein